MQESSSKKELVLFGEFHDNPITHWLQYELMLSLYDVHQTNLVLGFEMFEQDQQGVVDRYLSGELNEKQFKDSCRLWENYTTDYKPLLDFAKDKKLTCIASNVERKYASLLFHILYFKFSNLLLLFVVYLHSHQHLYGCKNNKIAACFAMWLPIYRNHHGCFAVYFSCCLMRLLRKLWLMFIFLILNFY